MTTPLPFRVRCPDHGPVLLTFQEYDRQMSRPDHRWTCPTCRRVAPFDDEWYETHGDNWLAEHPEASR